MNIEKTISEHAVSDILTPMLASQDRIVTEDVAPLFDQATGLDTPPASGTVTTTIEESRNLITAIIRKAWTATLTMLCGASVIGYITAAYTYLRNRLQGNETYGIPDRRSEISASSPLAANLALLNDRKIGGVPEAVDGMSLVHLLCSTSAASSVTEIKDTNYGWTCPVDRLRNLFSVFPNIEVLYIGFSDLTYPSHWGGEVAIQNKKIRRIYFTDWVHGDYSYGAGPNILSRNSQLEEVHAPVMKTFNSGGYPLNGFTTGETSVEGGMKLYFDVIESISNYLVNTDDLRSVTANVSYILIGCTGIKSQQVAITYEPSRTTWNTLLDVEIGDKYNIDKGLAPRWVPCQNIHIQPQTLTAENMYNHILLRLKQDEPLCGSGVTITLGTTNIEKLEAVEEYNTKLTELEDTYGYTFA